MIKKEETLYLYWEGVKVPVEVVYKVGLRKATGDKYVLVLEAYSPGQGTCFTDTQIEELEPQIQDMVLQGRLWGEEVEKKDVDMG